MASEPSPLDNLIAHPNWGGQVTLLHLAVESGRADAVAQLLAAGASPNPDSTAYDNWPPLQIAIHRDYPAIVELLLQSGAALTIWAAAALGDLASVQQQLAQVHSQGPNSATPLHFSATVPTAELLLAHGASLTATDKYGRNPASALAQYGTRYRDAALFLTEKTGDMDLQRAVELGEFALVRQLYQPGAAVLPSACALGHTGIVEFLLDRGADPETPDPWNNATAHEWARFHRQPAMAGLLKGPL